MNISKKNKAIAEGLYERGWIIVDDYVSEELCESLLREQQDILRHGQFRLAGIGKGDSFTIRPEIRSDKVFWLDEGQLSTMQEKFWKKMEALREKINQRCFLGLRSFESHFAIYPPGSFYLRHLDQFQSVAYRMVTVILYLNQEWREEDGGALRIYFPDENGIEKGVDVYPRGGRLVCFLSGEIPHEVMCTKKERVSITGWFRNID